MFIGHYAVALAAKKAAPKTSLGTLLISAQFLDLLWPILLLLGLENVRPDPGNTAFSPYDFYNYPISHSLLTVIGWSLVVSLIYFAIRRYGRGAWIVGLCVLSHWILDAISHRPDIPLIPGVASYVGLGLWNSVAATVIVEGAIFVAGVILYIRTTTAVDRIGRYSLWGFVVFCIVLYVGNILNKEPASESALAIGGLFQWIIIPWTYWVDRHRKLVTDGA